MLAIGAVSGRLLSLDSTLSEAFGGEVLALRLKVAPKERQGALDFSLFNG